jgi:hypothetical protein
MSARRSYRHLDRPFVVFLGLGPGDLFLILVGGAVLMVATNPVVGLVGGILLAVSVRKLKEGKPRGYAFYLFYRSGLLAFVPENARPPYLIRPPLPGESRIVRFSPVPGPGDDETAEARYWKGPKRFIA